MKNDTLLKEVATAMGRIDICMMQTVGEHGVSTRPMSNNGEVQYDGDNWFFSRADSNKNREIALDDRVQLLFSNMEDMDFISVWGRGEVVDDVEMKKKLWQDELSRWFKAGPEDPEVTLIKVSAERIQTWGRIGDCAIDVQTGTLRSTED